MIIHRFQDISTLDLKMSNKLFVVGDNLFVAGHK